MPWVKLDDHFDEHPKIASVGPLGVVLWVTGLAYCNRNLTDGFIPWSIARTLVAWDWEDATGPTSVYIGSPESVHEDGKATSEYAIESLVAVGLWDRVSGGYRIHDFAEYQPTKADVEAERATKAAAGRAGGLAAAQARAIASAKAQQQAGAQAKSKPVPVPVPVPRESELDAHSLGAREGLRHITPGVQSAGEAIAGTGILSAGEKQLTELDRLCEQHGAESVIDAMQAVAGDERKSWRQLVWDSMKRLEPFSNGRKPTEDDEVAELSRKTKREFEAHQRREASRA